jgi:hypothetical protein
MTREEVNYTLGSLFDGSGGFPLAGSLCGITPTDDGRLYHAPYNTWRLEALKND